MGSLGAEKHDDLRRIQCAIPVRSGKRIQHAGLPRAEYTARKLEFRSHHLTGELCANYAGELAANVVRGSPQKRDYKNCGVCGEHQLFVRFYA